MAMIRTTITGSAGSPRMTHTPFTVFTLPDHTNRNAQTPMVTPIITFSNLGGSSSILTAILEQSVEQLEATGSASVENEVQIERTKITISTFPSGKDPRILNIVD